MNAKPRRIKIFDTTLRDGEQSPGCSMNLTEKMEIAQALVDLGVDIIEAGFPIASPGDFEAVREIATNVRGTTICGLARCNDADIDRAWEALKRAPQARIHVFLATSAIHREYKLNMAKEQIVHAAVEGVKHARSLCADKVVLSVHCHNDLGMAVANSLAAVRAGARQIECTINGIGERAGNCSLEEATVSRPFHGRSWVREGVFRQLTPANAGYHVIHFAQPPRLIDQGGRGDRGGHLAEAWPERR
jgi:isopropylmalate/homocitrate/citramalate synthase